MVSTDSDKVVLPYIQQGFYFILIAMASYMGLESFMSSLSNFLAYPVSGLRLIATYAGFLLLLGAIVLFRQKSYQFNRSRLGFIAVAICAAIFLGYVMNQEVIGLLYDGDDSIIFRVLHVIATVFLFIWIGLCSDVYFSTKETPRRCALSWVYSPVITLYLYGIFEALFIWSVGVFNLSLIAWPLWFKCVIFSCAIVCSSNLIGLLYFAVSKRAIAYKIILAMGVIILSVEMILINMHSIFKAYIFGLAFEFPYFIK